LVIADHVVGLPVLRALSLVYMPSPIPRRSKLGASSARFPSRISFPRFQIRVSLRIVLFEACSAFTRVTACTLAPSPYFVTASPKASTVSLPPQLLRLHPAGAVAGWDFHPLESAAFSRRTRLADIQMAIGVFKPTVSIFYAVRVNVNRSFLEVADQISAIRQRRTETCSRAETRASSSSLR
jgi:hypothetical protein